MNFSVRVFGVEKPERGILDQIGLIKSFNKLERDGRGAVE